MILGEKMIKKVITTSVILLFLGLALAPTFTSNTSIKKKYTINTETSVYTGNTLYVGGNGPGNYTKIQDAINDANNSDTVFVYNGTYYERVNVQKSIQLIGEKRETTIVDAGEYSSPISLSAPGITVNGFTVRNSGVIGDNDGGIRIKNYGGGNSNNNIITGNIMVNNRDGIFAIGTDGNLIADNIFLENRHIGIYFQSSNDENKIYNNTFHNLTSSAIYLFSCHHNEICDNDFYNLTGAGVSFCESVDNYVYSNTFNKTGIGVVLGARTSQHHVYENTFCTNTIGIDVRVYASSHKIYHNNFINNTKQAYDECPNTWDNGYPSGGNYWDDYTGQDQNGDGIGDTPYYIPEGLNKDRYPLIKPYQDNQPSFITVIPTGGLCKVRIDIHNERNTSIENITWTMENTYGIILPTLPRSGELSKIQPRETITLDIKPVIGLGLITCTIKIEEWTWNFQWLLLGVVTINLQ